MPEQKPLHVLFIDNFDSFVFNLVDEFEKRRCRVSVWRNDMDTNRVLSLFSNLPRPSLVVLSPGPGAPETAGCCPELVRMADSTVPMFGVCLGQQIMTAACGGEVVRADQIVHGKSSEIETEEGHLFQGLPSRISVGRYHSLRCRVDESVFRITARCGDVAMAIEHRHRPLLGVQFHPESILTPTGGRIIENVIEWAGRITR